MAELNVPDAVAPPDARPDHNEDTDLMPSPAKLIKWGIFVSLATTLLPLHIWGAYNFSIRTVLYGYLFAVIGAFYGIAAIVLLLGVMVPPIMLAHWIWEVWSEPVPVGDQEGDQIMAPPPLDPTTAEEDDWVDEDDDQASPTTEPELAKADL